MRTAEGGGLVARDEEGREVFSAPAPLMWDSSVEAPDKGVTAQRAQPKGTGAEPPGISARDGRRLAVMPVRVENGGLIITPDQKILADPAARLPIFIDPSWTASLSGSAWTSVWSKSPSSSFWQNSSALQNGSTYGSAGAGRTEDCSGCADHIVRSLFRMDTTKVRGKQILAAEFRIEQRHAWTCSPKSNAKLWLTGAISSGTTWNRQPTWYGDQTAQTAANRKVGAAHGCAGTGTVEFNVKSMVTKAAAGKWTTLTVGLRALDEGSKNQWKRFNHSSPKLAITYNTPPNAPGSRFSDAKDCATGTARPYVRTLTPALAGKQSDPDGDQGLTTSFYWWPSGGSRSETNKVSKAAGNNTSVAATVPAGRLADGGTYVWQARTADAHSSGAWSATCEFTVDVTAPGAPSDVTSADYPEDSPTTPARGGVGLAGEFEFSPPSAGASEVVGYAWSLDDSVQPSAATQVTATAAHTATVTFTPVRDGVHTMYVWARDRAGWYTPSAVPYTFKVKAGAGPAAHWMFDEASGNAADATGHGNTVTPSAGVTRTPGRSGVGKALDFNGSAQALTGGPVMTPHPDTEVPIQVRTDSSFTVTAWVRVPSTTGVTGIRTAVAADATRRSPFMLAYHGDVNKWRFSMTDADSDSSGLYHAYSDATAAAGRWTHLAGVFDVSTRQMKIYVNGQLQSSTATLPSAFNTSGVLTIGRRMWNGGADSFFTGSVDEVRLYNYAVPAAQLLALALPLPPSITLPGGDSVPVGTAATAVIGAGGDTNVTSYKYSIGSTALNQIGTATNPGATVTIPLPTADPGTVSVYAVAVDGSGRQSPTYQVAQLRVVAPATLSGFVTDADFNPLPGAVVTVESTGRSAAAVADGSYTVSGFSAGTYTVRAAYGGACGLVAVLPGVEISGDTLLDLMLTPVTDGLGYTCATQNTAFSPVNDTVLALAGDDAVAQVGIPFAFPFYGASYRSAWVDTNGMLSFTDPGGSHPYDGTTLPAPAEPNAVVAPFWDDLVVDAQSSVRTAATGTGEAARFTVEWRNVHRKDSTTQRLSFEVTLAPDGTVTTNYDSLDNDAERGIEAAVGIEAPAGEDGFTFSRNQAALTSGRAVVFDHPEAQSPIDVYDLSGTLVNASGTPVVGATVTLDPSGLTTTTGAGGAWRFDDLVADSYTVTSTVGGRCRSMARAQVELAGDTVRNLQLGPDHGGLGYACATGAASFVPATTVLPLTGDDAATQVTMPFPITFHGRQYTTGWVHTNGMVSFGDVSGLPDTYANPTMPTAAAPNAVVAPFWDDFQVDAPASVLTLTQGAAPNRSFAVEWRNVGFRPSSAERVTFEVIFHEDGRIAFHYGPGMTSPTQQGGAATIGLENASGTVAALYSFHEATFLSNSSIVYTPAPAGTVSGTLTTAVTGMPVSGATVTLNPGGRTATTGADGGFQLTGLPVGEYTLAASTGDNRCAGQYAKQTINHPGGTSDVDLSLMLDGDEFGYECAAGPQTFVPGDITEGWTGDETVWQKNPPFPVKLYGNTYTSAWISANGLVSFKDPTFFGWIGSIPSPIPSPAAEGVPNAAVYVHWDDWVVDSQARIATKVSGTTPNRQWVVEWRNVHHFEDPTARATFEVIFHENGAITFAYADITATSGLERGSGAMVGIENASGTIGFQYLFKETWLASGQGVSFTPTPPGAGTVSGTVTCQDSPVPGATVAVSGQSATTGADGGYEFPNLPAGTYAVVATLPSGNCRGSKVTQITVGTNTQIDADFPAGVTASGAGYTLAEQAVPYTPIGGTVLPLTGDEAYGQVSLPFPVTLYGQSYNTGWVDTNGLVAFIDPGEPSSDAWPIPSPEGPEEPNAAIYPFWHDWVVDTNASIRTATAGTAPNRQYIVEWRNVHSYEDPTTRVTFQLILDETGGFRFAYADIDGTYLELGGGATIGIENADGTIALQYTYRQPVLRPGTGIRITPPTS
ncbi:carboxypeptidase regulatory-like domain-containing protein [Phytohabitans sp. ZYX-F-186]|uniref:Carboxypeptidase regulatory-like domain-containing protein n=1 Tax=Phytohabitans maris TaxID=3071409 RepID=A0ABU0ZAY4_9ACTN|nr:carboxypeptidase regulatory-like domain-containing protein [Phytohabitans sp. ZYX-F-186]MDQ7903531.1 carboxypeptidase regulatory-like domain-containing protein [Phytohabitans sp. ZYX-F-186]